MLEGYVSGMNDAKWRDHPRVTTAKDSAPPQAGRVTPDLIERRKLRTNKPFIPSSSYFNDEATVDSIRHFVDGMGDTNPLFRDAAYAGTTKYGDIIAPGAFLLTHQ